MSGLQHGATSFDTCTLMSLLEVTNKLVRGTVHNITRVDLGEPEGRDMGSGRHITTPATIMLTIITTEGSVEYPLQKEKSTAS